LPSRGFKHINARPGSAHGRAFAFLLPAACLLLMVALLFSCAPAAQITRESSRPARPGWIDKPPLDSGLLYFVGISTGASTLEDGMNAAINDAVSKVSDYTGIRIESFFEEQATESQDKVSRQVKSRSKALVQGASVKDSYHEKLTRMDRNFTMQKYDVYVLVSYSKEEASNERERKKRELADKAARAYAHYSEGGSLYGKGRLGDALLSYRKSLSLLAELDDVTAIDAVDVKDSGVLSMRLESAMKALQQRMRLVSLSIDVKSSSRAQELFLSRFAAALGESGFTVTSDGESYLISGMVTVSERGIVMNNYSSYAEGSISVRRAGESTDMAVFPFRAKGFHRDRTQSAFNALSEAAQEAGKGVAALLIEKEGL